VKEFPPRAQVTATAWAVVAVLSAMREQSKDLYEARTAFNRVCDEALALSPATDCGPAISDDAVRREIVLDIYMPSHI